MCHDGGVGRECSDGEQYSQYAHLRLVLVGHSERFRIIRQQTSPSDGISVHRSEPILLLEVFAKSVSTDFSIRRIIRRNSDNGRRHTR